MKESIPPNSSGLNNSEVKQIIKKSVDKLAKLVDEIVEEKIAKIELEKAVNKFSQEQKKGKSLNEYLEFIRFYSTQASIVNRTLSLSGIAIIWIFKKQANLPPIKDLLNFPLWCLGISLAIDLLQYTFGAIAWNIFYEYKYNKWKKNSYDMSYSKDISAPNGISLPITLLFFTKIIFTGIAYFEILKYLLKVL